MTADKHLEFQVPLSDAGTEATTWSIAYTDRIVSQVPSEIYGITSKEQMQFKKDLSICVIEFEAWWQAIGCPEVLNTIQTGAIHFRCQKMHLMSHISDWIRLISSGNNFTNNFFEWLHIANVKVSYQSTNNVNFIQQMLKYNDQSTGLD